MQVVSGGKKSIVSPNCDAYEPQKNHQHEKTSLKVQQWYPHLGRNHSFLIVLKAQSTGEKLCLLLET